MRFDQWQDSEGNTVYDGATGGLIVPGLVAVKSALKTDTFTASVGGQGNVAVTDLSITHEVSDPANKLIITAFFGAASNSEGLGLAGLGIHDGTGLIALADSATGRNLTTAGGYVSGDTTGNIVDRVVAMPSVSFVHTPGSGSKTYTVRAINLSGSTKTVYINRAAADFADARGIRAVSSLVIQEVAV
jgi:hypothetical protein